MKKNKIHIIWAIVVVIALVGGFFWGKGMAASGATAGRGTGRFAFGSSTTGFAGRGGFAAGGGFTAGQVTAVNGNSLMLQLANGNSENVFFSSSTQVIVPQPASISSIQPGAMVMVGGTQNSDGSVTASTIQVRNAGGGAQGGGSPSGNAASQTNTSGY